MEIVPITSLVLLLALCAIMFLIYKKIELYIKEQKEANIKKQNYFKELFDVFINTNKDINNLSNDTLKNNINLVIEKIENLIVSNKEINNISDINIKNNFNTVTDQSERLLKILSEFSEKSENKHTQLIELNKELTDNIIEKLSELNNQLKELDNSLNQSLKLD